MDLAQVSGVADQADAVEEVSEPALRAIGIVEDPGEALASAGDRIASHREGKDRKRSPEARHLDHHRDAVAGDDEAVGVGQQAEVGILGGSRRPLVQERVRGKRRLQRGDHRLRGAAAGGDVERSLLPGDHLGGASHEIAGDLGIEDEGLGLPAHQECEERAIEAREALGPLRPALGDPLGVDADEGKLEIQDVRAPWQAVLARRDDQLEAVEPALGSPEDHEAGAILRLLADPERGHRGAAAHGEDQVRPRGLQGVGALVIEVVERGRKARLAELVLLEEVEATDLDRPAQGVGDDLHLGVVAELVADHQPGAGVILRLGL